MNQTKNTCKTCGGHRHNYEKVIYDPTKEYKNVFTCNYCNEGCCEWCVEMRRVLTCTECNILMCQICLWSENDDSRSRTCLDCYNKRREARNWKIL
jgi:hypothetical protein